MLLLLIAEIVTFPVSFILGMLKDYPAIGYLLGVPIALIYSIFLLSLLIRRAHDVGKSGWFLLWCYVPLIQIYAIFLIFFSGSEEKTNIYGAPPDKKNRLRKILALDNLFQSKLEKSPKARWSNKILILVLIALVILLEIFSFYWFQIRPAKIKHDCSWVKKHSDATPAKRGLTKEDLQEVGLLQDCDHLSEVEKLVCSYQNAKTIDENKPQKSTPAKDWWIKATKEEYQFCLHDKGL